MIKQSHTMQRIASGYLELAEDTSLRKITVQTLCDYVGINRSSFYYHFGSIQELIHWIYSNEVNQHVRNNIKLDLEYMNQITVDALSRIYKRRDFWQRVLRLPTKDEFVNFMFSDVKDNWHELVCSMLTARGIEYDDLTESQRQKVEYIIDYYSAAHQHVTVMWMNRGMKQAPEELAKIIDDIALNGFFNVFESAISDSDDL